MIPSTLGMMSLIGLRSKLMPSARSHFRSMYQSHQAVGTHRDIGHLAFGNRRVSTFLGSHVRLMPRTLIQIRSLFPWQHESKTEEQEPKSGLMTPPEYTGCTSDSPAAIPSGSANDTPRSGAWGDTLSDPSKSNYFDLSQVKGQVLVVVGSEEHIPCLVRIASQHKLFPEVLGKGKTAELKASVIIGTPAILGYGRRSKLRKIKRANLKAVIVDKSSNVGLDFLVRLCNQFHPICTPSASKSKSLEEHLWDLWGSEQNSNDPTGVSESSVPLLHMDLATELKTVSDLSSSTSESVSRSSSHEILSFTKSPTRALLRQLSDNPWIIVGRDKFAISVGVSNIVVSKIPAEVVDHQRWRAFGHTNKAHSKMILHESDDLAELIERVDTISSLYLMPNTRWRTKDSSSEQHNLIRDLLRQQKQGSNKKVIDSFWVPGREEVGGQLIIEDLTRGEACDTITRLMLANVKTIKDDLL